MTTFDPDKAQALGLVRPGDRSREYDADTIDGTITDDPTREVPIVLGNRDIHSVTETVAGWIEKTPPKIWIWAFFIAAQVAGIATVCILYLIITGVGVWGLQNPVSWGWAIVNFVWWVGIGHAGTLISAILCLLKQKWRVSINRFAEAMTIFAVVCAGTFPGIHVGRVWFAWFLFPIPNYNWIWQNFRSPLLWDVFAVGTYFTVSLLFWYMGMIPDLAVMRDRALKRFQQKASFKFWAPHPLPPKLANLSFSLPSNKIAAYVYGVLSMGWRFSGRGWHNYEKAYLLLAGIATPLVLSVHSVVSFDFAVSILPGWHTTIFPPYFVAGAVFSGFAMVLTLLIPFRELYPGMKDFVTARTIENMCKIITVTGSMVGFAYIMEFFIAWYGGNLYESEAFIRRAFTGDYTWAYWIMMFCNVISPQVFWFKWCRTTLPFIFFITILVNIGMWFERFVIVSTLSSDFLPSSWDYYSPTIIDILTFVGSLGIFMSLFLLFARFIPMMPMAEIKAVMPQANPHNYHNGKYDPEHAASPDVYSEGGESHG